MKHKLLSLSAVFMALMAGSQNAEAQKWIDIPQEAKPYTRWWWLGSAVDKEGLTYNLEEFAKAGIGGVEITPIYGVKGNDANEIPYLSPKWMQMLKHTEAEGKRLGIEVDMATGTGWPFGGPLVKPEEGACKLVFKDGQAEVGRTGQKVKRAAPGGEGLAIDHFDRDAVAHYLARFDSAFANQGVDVPKNFFNDSYEVYGADWTPRFFEEFKARRGYDLQPLMASLQMPNEQRTDKDKRIVSDYRETLAELLYENFTTQWTDWAHRHGSLTRNQAHGSPANLLDLYAAVDIPECEGFGLSDFGIKGLRKDTAYTRKNFSDISMLKYASSGAHLSGAKLTSSETFTWLTEHFRTSLSQCKPDLDLMFVSGVNHVFFHGSCYSPKGEEWPGWRFYASVDMSPNNSWWTAMPDFSQYIARCQSFLQWGEPDNDVLVYLPFYDMIYEQAGTVALFDIHSMEKRAPKFIEAVQTMVNNGYGVDYISDRYISRLTSVDGTMKIDGTRGEYATIVVPDVQFMPLATLKKLVELAENGANVVFVNSYPTSVPGYNKKAEQKEFAKLVKSLPASITLASDYASAMNGGGARAEFMRSKHGISYIRRRNADGYHYFITNLQGKNVDFNIPLGVGAAAVVFYNPMTGDVSRGKIDDYGNTQIQLYSGESVILRTFDSEERMKAVCPNIHAHKYLDVLEARAGTLTGAWTLTFKDAAPKAINKTYKLDELKSWTELGDEDLKNTMATGVYTTSFMLDATWSLNMNPYQVGAAAMILDLGDVREIAHVYINDKDCGTLFAPPYRLDITKYVHGRDKGPNKLRIEVTNLPANRIAQLDREGKEWRKFKEINVVDLNYKKTHYDNWEPVPSGLCSGIKLIPAVVR
jgi:hypothetical protein